jgi:hypothetical protein
LPTADPLFARVCAAALSLTQNRRYLLPCAAIRFAAEEVAMNTISISACRNGGRAHIGHAAILAAPLWASGLVFLAVLFAITKHGQFFSLQFLAMSVAIVFGTTVAALRVMDRDLHCAQVRSTPEYRRMKSRARRFRAGR